MRNESQMNFRTILLIAFGVMIVGLASSALAGEVSGAPGVGSEKAVAAEPAPAQRCFIEQAGNACDQYNDGTPQCPDTIIFGDACSSVLFAQEGFSNASSYTANCKVNVGTPNQDGGCDYSTETIAMSCKSAQGTACPAEAEPTAE